MLILAKFIPLVNFNNTLIYLNTLLIFYNQNIQ